MADRLTSEELDELVAREKDATRGEWVAALVSREKT